MVDSDNILTATLAELKTYFEGWHTSNYNTLHTGISSSISDLQAEINNIKNKLINDKIVEALKSYYNKDQSDERYLLGYPNNKINNSNYSDENLKIQTNKKNKEAIVNENEPGLITPSMYETLLQLSDPTKAQASTAMDVQAGHDTNGKWKKTNPVFGSQREGTTTNYTPYINAFGYHTQMTRFGAMRTLTMAYENISRGDSNWERRARTFFGLDKNIYEEYGGEKYYLIVRMAEEDAPLTQGVFFGNVTEGLNLSFHNYPESSGTPNKHNLVNSKGTWQIDSGTWLVASGPTLQDYNGNPPDVIRYGVLFILGSITWVAKNIKE